MVLLADRFFFNLQLIRVTLDRIDKTNESGILITLDQEKAFDRVDHSFLMRTLLKSGFGPYSCKWVSLLYHNVFSRIIVNGNLSAPVSLERGVRQGCPLSVFVGSWKLFIDLNWVLAPILILLRLRPCGSAAGGHNAILSSD